MDEDQDEQSSGTQASKRRVPDTGMTRAELEHARRVAEDGWRVMDSIDQSTLGRIQEAADASAAVRRALDRTSMADRYAGLLPSLDIPIPEGLLHSTGFAQSIAEQFANTHDTGALARLAMSSTADLANSMRIWDQVAPQNSALNEMMKQIGESTSRVFEAQSLAISPARASIAESLSTWNHNSALRDLAQGTTLGSAFAAGKASALSRLVEGSSLYAKSLSETTGISASMELLASQSTSEAVASLLDSPAYESLRSSLYDDSTFVGLHSLMEQTDSSSITSLAQRALGGVPFGAVQEAAARLASTDPDLDEDEFEEAAIRALREVDEDYDPDVPPTPEDMAATEAFVRLLIALRPDLSDDPALRKRVKWVATGGGALVGVYLLTYHGPVFAALGTLLIILGVAKSTGDGTDRLLSPGAHEDDTDSEG